MASNGQNVGLHFEGVLEKAGKRFFEGFRKRWFILDGKDLSYYKAPETTPENLLGIIDLTKVKAVNPFKMINNNAFQIITSTRTYTFTAATPQLMTEWISVLRQAMQLQSFTNKRARYSTSSIRASSEDDAGYEVVSSSSRTSSDVSDLQAGADDDLYEQVASSGKADDSRNFPIATYEAVGSFKRPSPEVQSYDQGSYGVILGPGQDIEAYDSVDPITNKKAPEAPEIGTYGVVGDSEVQTPNASNMYSVVNKTQESKDVAKETAEATYAEVGKVDTKPTKITPMSIICESDDEEEEDNSDNGTLVEENIEDIQDPLPPPKGSSYAVDQIRELLKDLKKHETSAESSQENHVIQDEETLTESTVIPESCERAFAKLKEFLNKLETN